MAEQPIYDFKGLKNLLIRKGYRIGKAEPWRKIDSEEVSLRAGQIECTSQGIYLIDDDGVKRQVFFYKRAIYLEWDGVYKKPSYHICKCEVVAKNMREYRYANTPSVRVLDKSNRMKETSVSDLPLCGYCASILRRYEGFTSSDFSEMIKKESTPTTSPKSKTEVDIFGYTKDWQMISHNYRIKHNYTCEKCGIQVSPFDHTFMEVHHKNKIKIDNRESNLQCLCVKCHSEVDPTHIHNFATGGKRLLIKLFLEKYGNNKKNGNDDLPF